MTRLPFEILLMIFEKIGFVNLIKLRSICKDWKSIIDNNNIIKELTIDDDKYYKFQISNNSKSIIFLDQFKLNGYQIFRKIISSNILHNLKYLNYFFNSEDEYKCKLINLNCFKLLEHLVLKIDLGYRSPNFILVHPNIKCLSVSIWYDFLDRKYLSMEINCPKCEKLKIAGICGLSKYDITYPERVKIFNLAICNYDVNEIDKFVNVETLELDTDCFNSKNGICSKISRFSKLKKIAIKFNDFKNCYSDKFYTVSYIRRLFYYLIDHDLISKKQIQLFLNNEEIKSKKQIKKLIDKEIDCSLDSIIRENQLNPYKPDYWHDLMDFRENSTDSH